MGLIIHVVVTARCCASGPRSQRGTLSASSQWFKRFIAMQIDLKGRQRARVFAWVRAGVGRRGALTSYNSHEEPSLNTATSSHTHILLSFFKCFSPAPVSRPRWVSPTGPPVHALLHVALVGLGVALLAHKLRGVHARAVARHHMTTGWVSTRTHGSTKNLPRTRGMFILPTEGQEVNRSSGRGGQTHEVNCFFYSAFTLQALLFQEVHNIVRASEKNNSPL